MICKLFLSVAAFALNPLGELEINNDADTSQVAADLAVLDDTDHNGKQFRLQPRTHPIWGDNQTFSLKGGLFTIPHCLVSAAAKCN